MCVHVIRRIMTKFNNNNVRISKVVHKWSAIFIFLILIILILTNDARAGPTTTATAVAKNGNKTLSSSSTSTTTQTPRSRSGRNWSRDSYVDAAKYSGQENSFSHDISLDTTNVQPGSSGTIVQTYQAAAGGQVSGGVPSDSYGTPEYQQYQYQPQQQQQQASYYSYGTLGGGGNDHHHHHSHHGHHGHHNKGWGQKAEAPTYKYKYEVYPQKHTTESSGWGWGGLFGGSSGGKAKGFDFGITGDDGYGWGTGIGDDFGITGDGDKAGDGGLAGLVGLAGLAGLLPLIPLILIPIILFTPLPFIYFPPGVLDATNGILKLGRSNSDSSPAAATTTSALQSVLQTNLKKLFNFDPSKVVKSVETARKFVVSAYDDVVTKSGGSRREAGKDRNECIERISCELYQIARHIKADKFLDKTLRRFIATSTGPNNNNNSTLTSSGTTTAKTSGCHNFTCRPFFKTQTM